MMREGEMWRNTSHRLIRIHGCCLEESEWNTNSTFCPGAPPHQSWVPMSCLMISPTKSQTFHTTWNWIRRTSLMSCHGCLMTCKILISLKVPFYFTLC